MRIAFFSDIHGNSYVLDDFFTQLHNNAVDMAIFCGDVFGYYYHQEEILYRFMEMQSLVCIKGNHDQMFLDMHDGLLPESVLTSCYGNSYRYAKRAVSPLSLDYIRTWADSWVYSVDGFALAAFHGSPEDRLNGRIYPDTPVNDPKPFMPYTHVILGHTHHKMVRRLGHCLICNPGSIGQQRDGKGCSFLVLDTASGKHAFHTVTYKRFLLRKDIEYYDPGNNKLLEVLYREQ